MTTLNLNKQNKKLNKLLYWGLILAFFSVGLFLVQKNLDDFQANVLSTIKAPPYDGVSLPILRAPIWTSLKSTEYKLDYDSMPADKMQSFPVYDPNTLKTPTESLGWKSASDLSIRNSKITFTTPYMGNYKLDGLEYAGSHLAIDIKIPNNTPVYSIGNGVVVKVVNQTTGFGKHLVIRHDNFPSFADKNVKTTYYSSYSHMNQILVAVGDVVLRGQLIGKSGDTGLATTPHLHYQIDNDQAPWHPYWPFTSAESAAAGLDFTGSINAGLGQDKAIKTTVNPMLYVQKYLGDSAATTTAVAVPTAPAAVSTVSVNTASDLPPAPLVSSTTTTAPITNTTTDLPPTPAVPVTQPDITTVAPLPNTTASVTASTFKFTHPDTFVKNSDVTFTLAAVDNSGNVATNYKPTDAVYFQILLGSAVTPFSLKPEDFNNGIAQFTVKPTSDFVLQIKASDNVISGTSSMLQSILFNDVSQTAPYYKALNFLKEHNVIGGYPDGSFKPEAVVSRVEALKFILKGTNEDLLGSDQLPFKDTQIEQWYGEYVATAFNRNIVGGYPDSTFKPSKTVNRAEFLKMLLLSADIKINPFVTRDVFKDVPMTAWYAAYVKKAKDLNIINAYGSNFNPEEGMTRAEVAETIYRLIMVKASGALTYNENSVASSSQISDYFNS